MYKNLKFYKQKHYYYLKSLLLGLIIACLVFVPFIIYDKGLFLYYGDYNVQDIPFYQLLHDLLLNGEFFWTNKTDLGANVIGSYTFYFLTSPFFWITLPFKSEFIPYLMGPILILKFAFATLTSYIYLKRYAHNQNFAIMCAIMYAFSGFSIYNIFFFHFHEAIIIFPLVLASFDTFMYDKKRGLFLIAIFSSCFLHYYFFAGQAVFLIIYWAINIASKRWVFNFKEFFYLILEAILGIGLNSIILFPTILAISQNPRTTNFLQGWNAWLYSNEQRYVQILQSFFFPAELPARPNFTPNSDAKWASIAAWLPMFGMTGVIAWIQTKYTHWLKRLLIALFIISFIPILNSSFQLFNAMYYARWFYMLTLIMGLATMMALESYNIDWDMAIKTSFFITLCIALPIGLTPITVNNKYKIGLMAYPARFWIYVSISILSLLIVTIIINKFLYNKRKLFAFSTFYIFIISILSSWFIISEGKSYSDDTHNFIIPHCINASKNINLPNINNCRVDIYDGIDNQAMFWQLPTIQAFHSIVPGSIMEFYPTIGVERNVASRPDVDVYGLRGLTSCKWLFDYQDNNEHFGDKDVDISTRMPGWSYYDSQNGFNIWQNDYYIPFGFTYKNYITRSQYNSCDEEIRHLLLLKAIVLEDESEAKYSNIMEKLNHLDNIDYYEWNYFRDCIDRKSDTCYYFNYGKNSFEAQIDNKDNIEKLVFFSIPFEKGWKAKVNQQYVEIEKVNVGFMAVKVPAQMVSNIEFEYITPGLIYGCYISLIFLIITLIYILIINKRSNKYISRGRRLYRVASNYDYTLLK